MEPDGKMNGPGWPEEWPTVWVTGKWVDIDGNYLTGEVVLTNSATRAVATLSRTAVIGGSVSFPLADGVPSGPRAQENADGVWCIEFPIGTDPDVVPTDMQLVAAERLLGADGKTASTTTVRKVLTEQYTLDNPYWISGETEVVKAQPGVVQRNTYWVDFASTGIPAGVQVGDAIVYLDTREMFFVESL